MLARLCGARKILELGTLGGFSTINLARALPPGGKLLSLEYSPKHAEVARGNIDYAGLSDRVEIRVGTALDVLPQIEANDEGPFDLFFIDADKENYPAYLDWSIKLSRPGSVILSDNLIRDGLVHRPACRQRSRAGHLPLQSPDRFPPPPRKHHPPHHPRIHRRPRYQHRAVVVATPPTCYTTSIMTPGDHTPMSTPQETRTPDDLREVIQGISTRIDEIGVRL